MKVHSNFDGQKSKKRLIAFSCATALASFAFIAKPAFAEEAKADNASNLDTTAATTANVETTADLVETKVVEAPVTTENVASTENTTNVSEQASTSTASSETASETASTTASESQAPAESAAGQTREAVTTDRAANEAASATADTNSETNVTGGQYYSDSLGNWYYKDASGKNLTGAQKIDGINVYFDENGIQVKGNFSKNKQYYDADSGALVTDCYINHLGGVYYVDKNGEPLKGAQTIQGKQVYFNDYNGLQVRDGFASNEHFYDKDGNLVTDSYVFSTKYNYNNTIYPFYVDKNGDKLKGEQIINGKSVYFDKYDGAQVRNSVADNGRFYDQDGNLVDLGKKHYVFIDNHWFYVDEDGKILKGEQVIDGVEVYFDSTGKQVKGNFAENDSFYDKDSGARLKEQFVDLNGETYYVDAKGKRLREGGVRTINGKEYTFTGGADPHLAREEFLYPYGYSSFYDLNNKEVKGPQFVKAKNGNRYYITASGHVPLGLHIINGELYMFDAPTNKYADGRVSANGLTKDYFPSLIPNGSHIYYFDKETATAIKNQYKEVNGNWYYFGPNWYALTGEQTIDGAHVYFHRDGKQAKGELVTVNDKLHYYDPNSGARTENTTLTIEGKTYHFDAEGNGKLLN